MKGQKGDPGMRGLQGEIGIQGIQGPKGNNGEAGISRISQIELYFIRDIIHNIPSILVWLTHFVLFLVTTIDCGGTITNVNTPETIIQSPNYPDIYPSNKDCKALIEFQPGQKVSIEFFAFSIEANDNCQYDWLEIRDGSDSSAKLIGSKMCGDCTAPHGCAPIASSGNTLHISFHSDGSQERKGFQLKIKTGMSFILKWYGIWYFICLNCYQIINDVLF